MTRIALLRAGGERPSDCAAEKRDELPPSHVEHRFSPVPTLMSSNMRRPAAVTALTIRGEREYHHVTRIAYRKPSRGSSGQT
jgi:hypothetical protein